MKNANDTIRFVASLPKAGTYLFASFLEELGFINTHWHVGYNRTMLSNIPDSKLLDFSLRTDLHQKVTRFVDVDRNAIMKLLPPYHFCVGHLPPHVFEPVIIDNISVIFLYRSPREMLMSTFDYFTDVLPEEQTYASVSHEEDLPRRFELYLEKIMPHTSVLWYDMMLWMKYRSAYSLSYDDLKDTSQSHKLQAAAHHFGLDLSSDEIALAMKRAQQSAVITRNTTDFNIRPDIWTPRCEDIFRSFGGEYFSERIDGLRIQTN